MSTITSRRRGKNQTSTKKKPIDSLTPLTEVDNKSACKICNTTCVSFPETKSFQCQRCEAIFCLKCLNKNEDEHEIFINSDLMWFCGECKEKVKEAIEIDKKIEEKCNGIMKTCMDKIGEINEEVKKKCDKNDVIEIVKTLMQERGEAKNLIENEGKVQSESMTSVLSEVNERKERELNLIMYGLKECSSTNREERIQHDKEKVKEVFKVCDVDVQDKDMTKIIRLGKYHEEKNNRPILISLKSIAMKKNILKGAWKLSKTNKELSEEHIRISNDLTKSERDHEKQLHLKAKELQENESGEYMYRVRGPPWARKIVKLRKKKNL